MSPSAIPERGRTALVAGAGGFIGGHLARRLLERGFDLVRCCDVKPLDEWFQVHERAENVVLDLRLRDAARAAVRGVDEVFNLAADMGGMGFIENNKAACMISVLINTHLLLAARDARVRRYFYASSACVYNAAKQGEAEVTPLREADAYPADPEDGYGWEKLFSERMCRHFREDFGLATRVARFHNVYGPHGSWTGGREKAPAAICRKVAEARLSGRHEIEVWGDGRQTRSFMWIDDCVEGIQLIHEGDVVEPLNLGSTELVTIDRLVDVVERLAGLRLERRYQLDAPRGVRGRNSDNTALLHAFHWEPSTPLALGMERTYAWVFDQVASSWPGPLPSSAHPWHASSSSTSTTGRTSRARDNT